MQTSSLISIIAPVYNVEKYLPRCIDSLLSQTYTNLELILVDDGSSDNSGKICDEYAKKDTRVKVIHQSNHGVNVARKNGFSCSTGEWIMFVDSDDTLPEKALEILLQNSEGVDIVSGTMVIYRNGSDNYEIFPSHIQEIGEYDRNVFLNQLFEGKRLCSLCRQLIKRTVLSEEILSVSSRIRFSEDFLVNLRLGMNINRVKGIKDIVYEYNYYQGNTVTSFRMENKYMDEYDAELLGSLSKEQKEAYSYQLYCYRLNTLLNNIDVKDINKTKMALSLRLERRGKKLPLRSRYGLMLLYIPSCKLRAILFDLYGKLAKYFFAMLKYGR